MPWTQGESGNPQGREPGTGKVQRLYAHVAADDLAAIVAAIVAAAKNGDMAASKLIVDRIWPTLKAVDPPVRFDLSEDATIPEQARAIVVAIAAGQLPVNQGAALLQSLAVTSRLHDDSGPQLQLLSDAENQARIHELVKNLGFRMEPLTP